MLPPILPFHDGTTDWLGDVELIHLHLVDDDPFDLDVVLVSLAVAGLTLAGEPVQTDVPADCQARWREPITAHYLLPVRHTSCACHHDSPELAVEVWVVR